MSTYVISDIHGEYDLFCKLLEKIQFSDHDELYIIGDSVDRGKNPVNVLLKVMCMSNVYSLAGNHEVMAYECLSYLQNEVTDKTLEEFETNIIYGMEEWLKNGGGTTLAQFMELDKDNQEAVLDYLQECMETPYVLLKVNNRKFLLVHAGLGNFSREKELDQYTMQEMMFCRPDYHRQYFNTIHIISGHTPTQFIKDNPNPGVIYKSHNNIVIDCGAYLKNGKLGALKLDDMKEFYVEKDS